MRMILPALVLLNAILAGLIALMPAVSDPEPPRITAAEVPSPGPDVPVPKRQTADRPDAAETAMFGLSGASEKKPIDTPSVSASQLNADDISLLGVLIAQQEGDRRDVMSLLKHGKPPIISRLAIGGILDGWKLISATRTTVTLLGQDGTTRVLQIGSGSKDKTPR